MNVATDDEWLVIVSKGHGYEMRGRPHNVFAGGGGVGPSSETDNHAEIIQYRDFNQ